METLTESIENIRKKDFVSDFIIMSEDTICSETNKSFHPDDLVIEEIFRFEGDSNPSDMAILYGISSKSGTKGILIDAYGTYANSQISEFIKNVPIKFRN
ncbi:MAG: phosphoribosylpyrophosphate synthetase [Ignavibacteria bacterium]